jgi:hypothetical protein
VLVENLKTMWKAQKIAPGHCTGKPAFARLRKRMGRIVYMRGWAGRPNSPSNPTLPDGDLFSNAGAGCRRLPDARRNSKSSQLTRLILSYVNGSSAACESSADVAGTDPTAVCLSRWPSCVT